VSAIAAPRPRWAAILRGALSFIVWLACTVGINIALARATRGAAAALAVALLVTLVYAGCVRFIEGRAPVELSVRGSLAEWFAGFAIGLLIFAVTIGIFALAGWYRPLAFHWSTATFAAGFALCVSTGFTEEIFARGYIFRFLQDGFGTWAAIAFSALIFGCLHAFNPGATAWTSIAIAIEAGILLASAYALTGRLWLAIGIHTSWNFAEGTIFGTPVSGTAFPAVMSSRLDGPALGSGGSFGPEGSLVTVAVCLALSAYFITRIVREGRVLAPIWNRARPAA
jgi:hypothetical protein